MPAFTKNGINVKRVSILHIANDVIVAGNFYAGLGFIPANKDADDNCSGWLSPDGSGVIISTSAQIAREFGTDVAVELTGQSIPYIHVHDIESARHTLGVTDIVFESKIIGTGLKEILVKTPEKTFILAEKMVG